MWIHRTAGLRSNTCKFPSHAAPPKQKKARRAEIRAKSVQAGLSLQIAAFLLRPQGFLSVRAAKCLVHPPAAVVRSRKMLSLWLRQRLVQVAHFCFPPVQGLLCSRATKTCVRSFATVIPGDPCRGKRKRGVQKFGLHCFANCLFPPQLARVSTSCSATEPQNDIRGSESVMRRQPRKGCAEIWTKSLKKAWFANVKFPDFQGCLSIGATKYFFLRDSCLVVKKRAFGGKSYSRA